MLAGVPVLLAGMVIFVVMLFVPFMFFFIPLLMVDGETVAESISLDGHKLAVVRFLGSPLGYAIRSGKLADAECLLKSGISPNAYDHMGESPLRIAITANNPDMVALLLKYGATTNRPSKDFQTPDGCGNENPVDVAKEVGNPKIIALLQGAETAGECTNRPLEEMKLMESVDPMRHPEMYQ